MVKQWNSAQQLEWKAKVGVLTELAGYRVDDLLVALNISVKRAGKCYVGCCPVHGGDNPSAFNIYPDGHTVRGNWKCRSRACHNVFKPTLLGLVQGVLSHEHLKWNGSEQKQKYDFNGSIRWLCKFVGKEWETLKPDLVAAEKHRFLSTTTVLTGYQQTPELGWTRQFLRGRLTLPSPYFLGRGYRAETLDKYDVGDSQVTDITHPMYHRAVVPVYDKNGGRVIGVTGRSLWPKCSKCQRWHDNTLPCPTPDNSCKWRHSKGFAAEQHLYNYWFAKDSIRKSKTIIVVEGPGDVWRLVEAGIKNVVALFGTSLTDPQQVLLESSGAMSVILLLDDDAAGAKATPDIVEALHRSFRISTPKLASKDIGEMSVEVVNKTILPLLC